MKPHRSMFAALIACLVMAFSAFATAAPPPDPQPQAHKATPASTFFAASPAVVLAATSGAMQVVHPAAFTPVATPGLVNSLATERVMTAHAGSPSAPPPDPGPAKSNVTLMTTSTSPSGAGAQNPTGDKPERYLVQPNFVDLVLASGTRSYTT